MTFHQIFRCWIVYNKSWCITIPPLLLLLYNFWLVIMMTYWYNNPLPGKSLNLLLSNGWLQYYAITISINIYATCMWWNFSALHDTNAKRNQSCYYSKNPEEQFVSTPFPFRNSCCRWIGFTIYPHEYRLILHFPPWHLLSGVHGNKCYCMLLLSMLLDPYLTSAPRVFRLQELRIILYWYG